MDTKDLDQNITAGIRRGKNVLKKKKQPETEGD